MIYTFTYPLLKQVCDNKKRADATLKPEIFDNILSKESSEKSLKLTDNLHLLFFIDVFWCFS